MEKYILINSGLVCLDKKQKLYYYLIISEVEYEFKLLIEAIPMCYTKNSKNKSSQTQLVLLSLKVSTCFDSPVIIRSLFEPHAGISSSCTHSWDHKMYYKDKRRYYSVFHSLPNPARTFQNMAHRVQPCLEADGGDFQHML